MKCNIIKKSPDEQRMLSNFNISLLCHLLTQSQSTITVPHEIQRAAAAILITDPPTTAFTRIEDMQSDKYLGVVLDNYTFLQYPHR